jgi:hypothetical protein
MFNPDPGSEFFHPGSRVKKIPDPGFGSTSKNLSIFNPKNCVLSSRKYDSGYSNRIWILMFYPSRIPDLEVKKAPDPGSQDPEH